MSIADQFCAAQLFENGEELLHGGECFVEGEMGDAVNVALFELLQGGTVLWRHDGGEALPLGIGAVHDAIGSLAGIDERGNPFRITLCPLLAKNPAIDGNGMRNTQRLNHFRNRTDDGVIMKAQARLIVPEGEDGIQLVFFQQLAQQWRCAVGDGVVIGGVTLLRFEHEGARNQPAFVYFASCDSDGASFEV